MRTLAPWMLLFACGGHTTPTAAPENAAPVSAAAAPAPDAEAAPPVAPGDDATGDVTADDGPLVTGPGHVIATSDALSMGQPETTGPIDPALARRYSKRHVEEVAECFTKRHAQKRVSAGVLWVLITVDKEGKVKSAKRADRTTLQSAEVEACVLSNVATWTPFGISVNATTDSTVELPLTWAPKP